MCPLRRLVECGNGPGELQLMRSARLIKVRTSGCENTGPLIVNLNTSPQFLFLN